MFFGSISAETCTIQTYVTFQCFQNHDGICNNLSVDYLSGTRKTHPYTRSSTLTSSGALISAPCPISCEISSLCPLAAERCIAVLPILSFT